MITSVSHLPSHQEQISQFIEEFTRIVPAFSWTITSDCIRASDYEIIYCPLSAIAHSMSGVQFSTDGYQAAEFLGISHSVATTIIGAADNGWGNSESQDLNIKMQNIIAEVFE